MIFAWHWALMTSQSWFSIVTGNLLLIDIDNRWVVLISFFLTSAATGVVQGSLSTNKDIIDEGYPIDGEELQLAKYIDLLIYMPANFISTYLIDRYGLRSCVRWLVIFRTGFSRVLNDAGRVSNSLLTQVDRDMVLACWSYDLRKQLSFPKEPCH